MTDETEIPDDVVERANKARLDAIFRAADEDATVSHLQSSQVQLNALRAAGRVFVEWEREQCAKTCEDDVRVWSHPGSIVREECAAAIRSRKA